MGGSGDVGSAIRSAFGSLEAPAGHSVVYRVGSGPVGLANRNAGTLEGVSAFLLEQEEKGIEYGPKITAYAVKLPQKFDEYAEMAGGKRREFTGMRPVQASKPWEQRTPYEQAQARARSAFEDVMRAGQAVDPESAQFQPKLASSLHRDAAEMHREAARLAPTSEVRTYHAKQADMSEAKMQRAIEVGARGGRYYVSPTGAKVYVQSNPGARVVGHMSNQRFVQGLPVSAHLAEPKRHK